MTKIIALTLSFLLVLKAVALIWLITQGNIGLGPDEAQYWTWSTKLDWGYYSKPPGIAWQIWLGTFLFGSTELGVRFGALVIGTLLPLSVYLLAATCRLKPWTCAIAALIFAFSPLGMLSSLLAITDGGLVLFWTLASAAFCYALPQMQSRHYYLIGALVLCGALFKWPIYLFWVFVAGWMIFKRQRFNPHLLGGMAFSLVGALPSFYWNSRHDWPTFKHVFATIYNEKGIEVGTTELIKGNFWEFIGAQAILLSPLLFILLLAAFWKLFKEWKSQNQALQFCGMSAFILLAGYGLMAVFKKMQGNWCDFALPSAVVVLSWYACEIVPKLKSWVYAGLALSLCLVGVLLSIPYLQAHNLPACCPIPFKSNPFKHNLGWPLLGQKLTEAGYDPSKDFLFADRYQISSILSFYGPSQHLAYFFNLHGIRKNQFDYWNGMDKEQVGQTGYFVSVENSLPFKHGKEMVETATKTLLEPYFEKVESLGLFPLFYSNGVPAKGALIFKCSHYNGKLPTTPLLY